MTAAMDRRQASVSLSSSGTADPSPGVQTGGAALDAQQAELDRQAQTIDAQAAALVERGKEIRDLNDKLTHLQGAYDKLVQEHAHCSANLSARDLECAQDGSSGREGGGERGVGGVFSLPGGTPQLPLNQQQEKVRERPYSRSGIGDDLSKMLCAMRHDSVDQSFADATKHARPNGPAFKRVAEDEGSPEKEGRQEGRAAAGEVLLFRSLADVVVVSGDN
jgi:hypothetical protein